MPYRLLADLVLLLHVCIVVFVILGLFAVYIGAALHWAWVRNLRFRIAHALVFTFVLVQAWLGKICPLTTLEMYLRKHAGDTVYEGGFIAHWLGELLYYDLPIWVFAIAYTIFGLLIALAWYVVRPQRSQGKT